MIAKATRLTLALLLSAVPAAHAAPPSAATSGLDIAEQIAAERLLLDLLADPDVQAVQRRMEKELSTESAAATPAGKAALHEAIPMWTGSLILREQAGDPAAPLILWTLDDSPHRWHGLTIPGRAMSGDNPDNIYRHSFFDGAGRYEISGRIDMGHRPSQLSFEFTRGSAGEMAINVQNRGKSDLGNQIAMLTDKDLTVAPDGSFRITIGPDGSGSAVKTPAASVALTVRESLADWQQRPARLTIRRLDAAPGGKRDRAALKAQLLADMPGYIGFWGRFADLWFGKRPVNIVTGPLPRDGGWGYLAFAPYKLAPDEALVIQAHHGAASYVGAQVSNAWTITPDVQKHFSSLNKAQAVPDEDGSYTYVVAAQDPGIANWLDNAGQLEGQAGLRWQGFPPGSTGEGLLIGSRVVKVSELAALKGPRRVTPQERQAALARRIADFRTRLGQ